MLYAISFIKRFVRAINLKTLFKLNFSTCCVSLFGKYFYLINHNNKYNELSWTKVSIYVKYQIKLKKINLTGRKYKLCKTHIFKKHFIRYYLI